MFEDGGSALAAMYDLQPLIALVDERTLSKQGGGIHRTKCNDKRIKHIPFIIMSDGHEGPFLAGDGSGAIDHFLKRPIKINMLLDHIARTVSHKVEKSWEKLPHAAHKTLRCMADQFDLIAKAVANNTPLDKSQITASCNPLADCVRENQHKYVLLGLRNHHNFTYVHSMRVAIFMSVFAQAYNISKSEMTLLATGGYMHDVGKILVAQAILNKPGKLNDNEWDEIRHHVEHSIAIINSIEGVNPIIRLIAEQHHERLDGSGYPNGLNGLEINEIGRMAAIADVFASLTDESPYRHAFDPETAFSIMKQMGPALDQHLLTLFQSAISD
ncbi:MAG: HD domain-containing protein [Magnetovibrio sp.]|nr:HD domain-containing protein [Magnetovibrio sp.]